MGRQPCCDKVGLRKGPWTIEEDKKLINFMLANGQCCWRALPKLAGLLRCGKSCRLRWTNYLRPDLKRGLLTEYEEKMVIDLHSQLGNRWSKIASHLPGRTDNEIKNLWNTHIKKKLKKMGIDPVNHKPLSSTNDPRIAHDKSNNPLVYQALQEQGAELIDTSMQIGEKEEDKCKNTTIPSDSIEVNNGFCIDEVPLVDSCKILSCIVYPSLSSSSSSSSSGCFGGGSSSAVEDLGEFVPTFDWLGDFPGNMDENFMSSLALLLDEDSETKSAIDFESPSAA